MKWPYCVTAFRALNSKMVGVNGDVSTSYQQSLVAKLKLLGFSSNHHATSGPQVERSRQPPKINA